MSTLDKIEKIIQCSRPLRFERGDRLPLVIWHAQADEDIDDATLERLLRDLDARGIGLYASWEKGANRDKSLALGLRTGALQKKLGLPVFAFCNAPLHNFFDGDERTAHIDEKGRPFFDPSLGNPKMGCPFALDFRRAPIRERIERLVEAYRENGIPIRFIFADWEIDGPIEWNDAWSHSKRCTRCRSHVPEIEDFQAFQKALRTIRSDMQKKCFAEPVLARFPDALVGNYAVYPCDGYRYWVDFFEHEDFADIGVKRDGRARYRPWLADEFALTGYTFAMPVVYTWARCYRWYDFENADWRWFYNMLLAATNACKSAPADVPVIPFVHHKTIWVPGKPADDVAQFSTDKYKELLWHMLLRGVDGFALWCRDTELDFEVPPLQEVYAESLAHKDFLDSGTPVSFNVPESPGPVVSGLRLGDRVLLRRTDFTDTTDPVTISIDGKTVNVPPARGKCVVVNLE